MSDPYRDPSAAPVAAPAKRARGTDLSKFQGDAPMARMVAEQQIEFAICKATEGRGYTDDKWERNLVEAPKHFRAVGCYHVLRGYDLEQQVKHAAAQWSRLRDRASEARVRVIPPVIDFEIRDGLTGEALISNAVRFRQRIEELTGQVPWLYSYASFLRDDCKNLAPKALLECPQWLAWYPGYGIDRALVVDPIKALGKFAPRLWIEGRWVAWQYDGDKGELMPNGRDADFNVANGSVEEMLGVRDTIPAPPDTIPETPTSRSSQRLRAINWRTERPYEQQLVEPFLGQLAEPEK